MRKPLMIVLIMGILIAHHGIAAAAEEQLPVIEPYVAQFHYTPSVHQAPGAAAVTFAVAKMDFFAAKVSPSGLWTDQLRAIQRLVEPDGTMAWFAFPQVANLPAQFRRAIAELLFASGFRIKGPYETFDAIPAADKKGIDFYLTPKIKLEFTVSPVKKPGTMTEKVDVTGAVILEIREMKSRDLIWSTELPIQKMELISEMKTSFYTMTKFNGIMNDVVKGLEQQLPSIMSSIATSLSPSAMKALKNDTTLHQGKTAY